MAISLNFAFLFLLVVGGTSHWDHHGTVHAIVAGAKGAGVTGDQQQSPAALDASDGVSEEKKEKMLNLAEVNGNTPTLKIPLIINAIFYINMESRTDRRDRMEAKLEQSGFRHERWPAMVIRPTDDLSMRSELGEELKKLAPNKAMTDVVPENRAFFIYSVFLSHITVLEHIMSDQYADAGDDDIFLIVEDDVRFAEGWHEKLQDQMKRVPEDWDVLRVGRWGGIRADDAVDRDATVFKATPPFITGGPAEVDKRFFYGGMHAVLVRRKTLPNLINFLKRQAEAGKLTDIDEMVTSCCTEIKSYAVKLNVVDQDDDAVAGDHPTALAVSLAQKFQLIEKAGKSNSKNELFFF